MFMDRCRGLAAGCGNCSPVDSGKDSREGAEKNSWWEEVPFRNCTGNKLKEDVSGLFLVQALCSFGLRVRMVEETFCVYIHKDVVDFVEQP